MSNGTIREGFVFEVDTDAWGRANAWRDQHDQEKHTSPDQPFRYTGAIGGAYTWEFTPTSLGIVIKIRCSCGEKLDLTDYDSW